MDDLPYTEYVGYKRKQGGRYDYDHCIEVYPPSSIRELVNEHLRITSPNSIHNINNTTTATNRLEETRAMVNDLLMNKLRVAFDTIMDQDQPTSNQWAKDPFFHHTFNITINIFEVLDGTIAHATRMVESVRNFLRQNQKFDVPTKLHIHISICMYYANGTYVLFTYSPRTIVIEEILFGTYQPMDTPSSSSIRLISSRHQNLETVIRDVMTTQPLAFSHPPKHTFTLSMPKANLNSFKSLMVMASILIEKKLSVVFGDILIDTLAHEFYELKNFLCSPYVNVVTDKQLLPFQVSAELIGDDISLFEESPGETDIYQFTIIESGRKHKLIKLSKRLYCGYVLTYRLVVDSYVHGLYKFSNTSNGLNLSKNYLLPDVKRVKWVN